MTAVRAVQSSLRLLSPSNRRRLTFAALLQMSTTVLDIIGVLLLGLVGVLAASAVEGNGIPAPVDDIINATALANLSDIQLALLGAGIAALLLIAKGVFSLAIIRQILKFLARRSAEVSARLARRFLSQQLTDVERESSQTCSYALGAGVTAAISGTLGYAVVGLSEAVLIVTMGLVLMLIDPVVTLAAFCYFAVIAMLLHLWLGRWAATAGTRVADAEVQGITTIQECVVAYRELLVSNRRDFYERQFEGIRIRGSAASADTQFITQVPKYVLEASLVVGAVLLGTTQLTNPDPTRAIGILALFLAAGTRIMPSILRLQGALTGIRGAMGLAQLTFDLSDRMESATHPNDQSDLSDSLAVRNDPERGSQPSVELVNVTFTYPNASEVAVNNVSLTLEHGTSLAVVGSTGAGKSTLADLVLGVIRPTSGHVRIYGRNPLDLASERPGLVSYVPQSVALVSGSVRDNVALALDRQQVDDDVVWACLEQSQLADLIAARGGLDCPVGERGVRLSGGQRQRIGIARALYTSPSLIVLDEATSSLDATTESLVTKVLHGLKGTVTTVTIAHRLATIREADVVAYLEHGRLIATGSFEEVKSTVPEFNSQAAIMGL